jgi:hypothetical protein
VQIRAENYENLQISRDFYVMIELAAHTKQKQGAGYGSTGNAPVAALIGWPHRGYGMKGRKRKEKERGKK